MEKELIITQMATKTIIDNYKEDIDKLQNWLSAWDAPKYCYRLPCYLRESDKNKIIIPAGLDKQQLENHLKGYKLKYINKKNDLDIFNTINLKIDKKYPPRDHGQLSAINFLMKNNTQKFLNAQTDFGKTYCCISYIVKSKKLPIILVDQLSLANQWIESIIKFTGITKDEIFIISGKETIDKLLNMDKRKLKKYKFYICLHDTLSTYMDKRLENVTELFQYLKIGTKIYDEAHTRFTNIIYIDELTNCESIYVTATPSRSNPTENSLYKRVFQNCLYFKSLKEENEDKFRNVIIIKWK